ncbi:MAG: agmatine/peptidylarginine deiminase [Candidatus Binatia bacterium]
MRIEAEDSRSREGHDSPRRAGFRVPAEWDLHRAVWTAWPAAADLWEDDLPAAQAEFTALCRAITADASPGRPAPELLEVLVNDAKAEQDAASALAGLPVRFHRIAYGDIWLRDTAPVFTRGDDGEVAAVCFRFNGWGEKYLFPADLALARAVRQASGVHCFDVPMIFEGGAIEVDGQGTAITTAQCLLNPNRNPGMTRAEIEEHLADALGIDKLLWLGDGLLGDHTDGHVDTLVRFAGAGRVLCMEARDREDPNREVLAAIADDLSGMRDALGRTLDVVKLPSPGLVESDDGEPMPASYVNFYISNTAVVVPTYGSRHDEEAVAVIASCFPGRRTVGSSARAILSGGGAFHCITQQEPAAAGGGA